MFVHLPDADILVSEFGAGQRTIVAHGGWVGSGELWHPPFQSLSRSWRCITYDHRGTGATRSRAPAITFDLLVRDLFRVLDARGVERCVIAGESMGAMVAIAAALEQPSRFDGLVIVCGRTSGEISAGMSAMIQGCRNDLAKTMAGFVRACVPEADCEAERDWGLRIVMRSNATSAVELMTCIEGVNFDARWAELKMPVLILQGARDVINPPANAEALAGRLPNASLVMHPDAGHVPTVTRPDWVADQISAHFN